MPTTPLLHLPQGLEITSISETKEELLVRVTSYRETSCCPLCGVPSSTIHSYYQRKPRDLPCAGRPIRLLLAVKKFFCRQPECSRKIFVERLPDLVEVSSRLTVRLRSTAQIHREVAEMGFSGGKTNVRAYIAHLRTSTADGVPPARRSERTLALSPRALRWLLTRERKDLDQEEQVQFDQLLTVAEEVQTAHTLLRVFSRWCASANTSSYVRGWKRPLRVASQS